MVRGGTAIYGFGASGGVVNLITKDPSGEAFGGSSSVSFGFSPEHFNDSGEYRTSHQLTASQGDWEFFTSVSYLQRNSRFDADGRRLPPDPLGAQGGFADTDQWNLLGKAAYDFGAGNQRIELTLNYFDVSQDTDYVAGSTFSLGEDPLPDSKRRRNGNDSGVTASMQDAVEVNDRPSVECT